MSDTRKEELKKEERIISMSCLFGIKENLEYNRECCIHRIPKRIRKINEEAYTPQLISIGPLHHGKKELIDMEEEKISYMKSFCTHRASNEKMEEISTFIKNNEDRIRNCYSERSKLDSDKFVSMIKYDAIFIIELLLTNCDEDIGDVLLDIPATKISLCLDLQLLENQLPYFVLEEIYKLAFAGSTFMKLSFIFFYCSSLFDSFPDPGVEVKHFTDLRRSLLLKRYERVMPEGNIKYLPCAMKLHESGVKFKCIKRESLLDIRFEKQIFPWLKAAELQIPNLELYDDTECLLRNMMVLEQCYYPCDTRVCSYISLIDSLIDTEKDVDLLVEERIITNCIGDNASVAKCLTDLALILLLVVPVTMAFVRN